MINSIKKCSMCGHRKSSQIYIRPDGFPINQCNRCGFSFLAKRPNDSDLEKIYNRAYFQNSTTYSDYFHYTETLVDLNYCPRVHRLESFVPNWKQRKVLEIGCAAGGTLAVLKKKGAIVKGVEISEDACRFAQNKLMLDVFHGSLDQVSLDESSFDVILAFDVLEHVPKPGTIIRNVKKLLKHNGVFSFSVPNFDCFFHGNGKWIGVESYFEHCNYFTNDVIRTFLIEQKFKCLDQYTFTAEAQKKNTMSEILTFLRLFSQKIRTHFPCVGKCFKNYHKYRFKKHGPPELSIERNGLGMDIFSVYKKAE